MHGISLILKTRRIRIMATNWEKVKEELTCVICQDLLNDPKILPCLHSFCTGCLKEWLGRLPYLEASKRELECPLCRGKVALSTPCAIEELPSHFSAVRLVEIVRLQEQASNKKVTPICQNCEDGEVATSLCSECAIFLCDFCEKAHRKYKTTSRHKLHSLDGLKKGSATDIPSILPEKVEMCHSHPTKPLELYCRCEDVLICRDCIIKKHKDHDYDVISDAVDGEKKILKEALPGIQQLIDEVEGTVNGVKSKRQDVKNRKEENLHRLDDAFHTLHAALDERKRQLHQQITQDTEGKDKGLIVQEDELCFLLSQLKSCWSFIDDKLQRGVNKDVLAMKRSMLERRDKLKEMKNKTHLKPVVYEQEKIEFDLDQLRKVFSCIGTFATVDVQKCFVSKMKFHFPFKRTNVTNFLVEAKNSCGQGVPNVADRITVEIHYHGKPHLTESATIIDTGYGQYEVSYTPRVCGVHTLSVLVAGKPIPGSPFKMIAQLRDYTKMETQNCHLITQYGGKKFQTPHDVAITTNDDIVIVDSSTRDVVMLSKNLKLIKTFGHGNGDGKLNEPEGVAVGHNVIAVSEWSDHVVKKFTLQGDYLSKFGSHGSGDGQFRYPQGLTFNNKGLLYVVDSGNCRVQVFNDSNKFTFKFGSKGSDSGQFQDPRCIAVDSSDQVYVTDWTASGGIVVFSEDGHFIKKISCYKPYIICLTPDDHIITRVNSCLTVFDPDYQLIAQFGTKGRKQGQFEITTGVTVNSAGTIFISEGGNARLQIITD